MKAGKILNIPDRDTVAAVDTREARKTISAHTADFNAYRQKLASAAAAAEAPKEGAAQQVATGKIEAKVEDKAPPPAETKDQLKVSKSEAAKDARAAQGKIAALEEDLVAKDKALKEAQSRQADLEKNLKQLQKLVELKNQSLAELQKQAEAKAVPAPEVKKTGGAFARQGAGNRTCGSCTGRCRRTRRKTGGACEARRKRKAG